MSEPTAGGRPIARDLTVVVPTLGREILRESLGAIAGGSELPARVIVVHQGDDARVGEWARQAPGGLVVEYVRSDRRGRATGVNTGIARVETRFVAVTDDDCLVDAEWTRRLAAHLRTRPDHLVTGRVDAAGDAAPVAVVTSDRPDTQQRPRIRFDRLSGGNMGGALDVLRRIGPLDEDPCLATAEDGEYAYRALRAGVPITYDPTIAVDHVGWRDEEQRERQYRSYARSTAGFHGKYLRRGDLFIALRVVVRLLRALRRWVIGLIRRDPDQVARGRAYVAELLPGLIAGWRSRS